MPHRNKILVVDDELGVRELLTTLIEGSFEHVSVLQAKCPREALELLQENPKILLVISDFDMPEGTGADLYNHLLEKKFEIPFIFFSGHDEGYIRALLKREPVAIFAKTDGTKQLKEKVKEFFKAGADSYCKFRPAQLLKMGILPSDAYVKIHEGKFVRVMYKGETFESEDFKHYSAKKLDYLYIKKEDFLQLILKMESDLKRINELMTSFQEDVVGIPASAHSMVREFYQKFGVNETVQRVVRETVELTMKTIKSQPTLKDLFKKIKQKEGLYLSYHSILLAHVSCMLAMKMEWTSSATTNKLVIAAFLHDLTLEDDSVERFMAFEKEIKERDGDVVRDPQLLKYFNHPQDAAELFDKIEQPIPDVSIILAQHHELPDGSGFPHKLNALTISPLSAVLITAHQLVDAYFLSDKDLDLAAYLNKLPQSFHKGNFKAVIRALTDLAIELKT